MVKCDEKLLIYHIKKNKLIFVSYAKHFLIREEKNITPSSKMLNGRFLSHFDSHTYLYNYISNTYTVISTVGLHRIIHISLCLSFMLQHCGTLLTSTNLFPSLWYDNSLIFSDTFCTVDKLPFCNA
jgi:hypothetical protein